MNYAMLCYAMLCYATNGMLAYETYQGDNYTKPL